MIKGCICRGRGYHVENLGRPAIFLIPEKKLKIRIDVETVEENLHKFLIENFGAYTSAKVPNFGFWKGDRNVEVFDECREYEVSFLGKNKIPFLLKELAKIAKQTGEECIYFKAGQYSYLVRPSFRKRRCG